MRFGFSSVEDFISGLLFIKVKLICCFKVGDGKDGTVNLCKTKVWFWCKVQFQRLHFADLKDRQIMAKAVSFSFQWCSVSVNQICLGLALIYRWPTHPEERAGIVLKLTISSNFWRLGTLLAAPEIAHHGNIWGNLFRFLFSSTHSWYETELVILTPAGLCSKRSSSSWEAAEAALVKCKRNVWIWKKTLLDLFTYSIKSLKFPSWVEPVTAKSTIRSIFTNFMCNNFFLALRLSRLSSQVKYLQNLTVLPKESLEEPLWLKLFRSWRINVE